MRFQKKPIIIDATPVEFILAVGRTEPEIMPEWIQQALNGQSLMIYEEVVVVKTLEGNMTGKRGDWLIKGVRGELYPCDGSIFDETYEQVES